MGLYDYGARWYDAALGRWGQVDPLAEEAFAWSGYHYVLGNPVRLIAPFGLSAEEKDAGYYRRKAAFDAWQQERDAEYGLSVPLVNDNAIGTSTNQEAGKEDDCCPGMPDYDALYGIRDEIGMLVGWQDPIVGFLKNDPPENIAHALGRMFSIGALPELKLVGGLGRFLGVGRNANSPAKGVTAPKGWITQASKKGGGTVFKDPSNPHNIIRQMPGNPNSPNVLQQNPYVKFMKDGKFYDVNGKVLPNGNVPEAHIPLNQFDASKMPKF